MNYDNGMECTETEVIDVSGLNIKNINLPFDCDLLHPNNGFRRIIWSRVFDIHLYIGAKLISTKRFFYRSIYHNYFSHISIIFHCMHLEYSRGNCYESFGECS